MCYVVQRRSYADGVWEDQPGAYRDRHDALGEIGARVARGEERWTLRLGGCAYESIAYRGPSVSVCLASPRVVVTIYEIADIPTTLPRDVRARVSRHLRGESYAERSEHIEVRRSAEVMSTIADVPCRLCDLTPEERHSYLISLATEAVARSAKGEDLAEALAERLAQAAQVWTAEVAMAREGA